MSRIPQVVFVNPARVPTGTAFVMPAAQVTLAGAVPATLDLELRIVDEAIERFDPVRIAPGDIVCVSALTNNCREAYRVARQAKQRGATVVMGGPHPTLLPAEAIRFGADAVVRGDGDTVIGRVLEDCLMGRIPAAKVYQDPLGGPFQVAGHEMAYPRLDLVDLNRYWTASIRSNPGCRESCTFCTVPTISGRAPRERPVEMVAREVRELHDRGIRIVLWGADNLVQIPRSLIESERNPAKKKAYEDEREKSLTFFRRFGRLTGDKKAWGFAQLTMRLWDDPEILRALRHDGSICAALFGIESVDPVALKRMAKGWNGSMEEIVKKIRCIEQEGIHVLGSMIIGLPTDTPETIDAMRRFSVASGMSVAQFPIYELLPGSSDYTAAKRELLRTEQSPQLFPIAPQGKFPAVRLITDEWWLQPDGAPPHLEHPTLPYNSLKEEGRKSWQHFYTVRHLVSNGIRRGWPWWRIITYAISCKGFARFYGGAVGLSADSVRTGDTSAFQKKLMALGTWFFHHKIPPPAAQ